MNGVYELDRIGSGSLIMVWGHEGKWMGRFVGFREGCPGATDARIGAINGLEHVKVELFAGRHANVKAVALDGVVNVLRIGGEDFLRALKGGEMCIRDRRRPVRSR